ncbi:hypothetical protein RB195_017432 [Necator americanus]|uniref:Reverse transcriptase domain-containing protein n=1 Tax=Necator americanus TaxID=51031 RepID=A0ABR1C572_NECAM
MLAEHVIQSIDQDHPHAHIWDAGRSPAPRTSWIPPGVQLLGPHPDRVKGHRALPGIPLLVLTFFDYEEAFDSVETNAILSALVDQGVDASFVRTLANCYDRCTTRIQLFHCPLTIPIGKGVRQGDTISPKLFTAALQWIMKSLFWEERGICVDGRFPSNLRFADEIVLFSSSTNEAEKILNELNEAGKRIGPRIDRKKTQFMKVPTARTEEYNLN